jgi:hypothetical protein
MEKPGRKPGSVWQPWTPEELARLREWAGAVPAEEIARRLGRTRAAVRSQATSRRLRLRVWRA